ncbi:hypothetical protein TcasGA2_TC013330 [Tribolium castaneum]|uniref:Uncharacterized protein n=1 Tax=Tribolium castaneum TaxID=7070 RepID=D6WM73_TRICA|nr:hypothetical protein TcasGA2_TC013330 [Tribolium castaneum]
MIRHIRRLELEAGAGAILRKFGSRNEVLKISEMNAGRTAGGEVVASPKNRVDLVH